MTATRVRLALLCLLAGCASEEAADTGADGGANTDPGAAEWAHWPMPNPSDAGLPNPARYTDGGAGNLLDEVTGLVWRAEVDARAFSFEDALTHCAALADGFRLPTAIELVSLIDFTRPGPTIAPAFSSPLDYFWSSTALAGDASRSWLVYFGDGHTSDGTNTSNDRVRCVRGSLAAEPQHYESVAAGVLDRETGLVWQALASDARFDFAGAGAHCASLGQGFRAPSMKELQTLVDRTRVRPSIDVRVFPATEQTAHWTSSGVSDNPALAWVVSFELGRSDRLELSQQFPVRCVR